jgi:hypothetical protein
LFDISVCRVYVHIFISNLPLEVHSGIILLLFDLRLIWIEINELHLGPQINGISNYCWLNGINTWCGEDGASVKWWLAAFWCPNIQCATSRCASVCLWCTYFIQYPVNIDLSVWNNLRLVIYETVYTGYRWHCPSWM